MTYGFVTSDNEQAADTSEKSVADDVVPPSMTTCQTTCNTELRKRTTITPSTEGCTYEKPTVTTTNDKTTLLSPFQSPNGSPNGSHHKRSSSGYEHKPVPVLHKRSFSVSGSTFEDLDLLGLPRTALDKAGELAQCTMGRTRDLAHSTMDKAGKLASKAGQLANKAVEEAEDVALKACTGTRELACKAGQMALGLWECVHHTSLPQWLKDNEYLVFGHRPQLNSFRACLYSIFRIHTETGNIWTHLLGFLAFIFMACRYMTFDVVWQEKLVFSAFFAGAILCMGFSWIFHAVCCHSGHVSCAFSKLDYCGIALLTVGSFVPWLYYSFYWNRSLMITYLIAIVVLGTITIIVSSFSAFATPKFRIVRAGTFIILGLSAVIPVCHHIATEGFGAAMHMSLGPLLLMAFLYISGAVIYAARIPEKWWPGKFDIWFQSHQIFHLFVVSAAFVHYHGLSRMATNRGLESPPQCDSEHDHLC